MTRHGTGRFQVTGWDEQAQHEQDGQKLTTTHVTETFSGDIEGESSVDYLMAYPHDSYAAIVGLRRVRGTVGGKRGSFLLQTTGTYENGTAQCEWSVVPGSGTGELAGLSGAGGYRTDDARSAAYHLDYAFR
jgi:hypothetical protein